MAEAFRSKEDYHAVEANQLSKTNAEAVTLWCGGRYVEEHDALEHSIIYAAINVPTSDGPMRAQEGDWIVKLPNGTFRPVPRDQFDEIFEAVVDG